MARLILILFAGMLSFGTPLLAQTADGPIAAESSAEVDAQIAIRLRDILGELGDFDDVTVTVSDGVVTFRGTTDTLTRAAELDALASRLAGVVAVKNDVTETADLGRRLDPAWDRFQARINQALVKLPIFAIAAMAFAAIVFAGFAIARMRRPWDGLAPNAFVSDIYRQLVRLAFIVLGIVVALDILNATALLSTILGAAGIIGLAIGFAVRDTVENFIASVLLSFRQPFRPNDAIEINGDEGKVIRLTSRATILMSFDGNQIRIPNATVFKSRIVNYSKNAERRFKFELLIDRDTDLSAARELMIATVQNLPFVLSTPETTSWIDRLAPEGAVIVTAGWVDQHETSLLLAQSEAIRMVKRALQDAGINLVNATQVIEMTRGAAATEPENTADLESAEVADVHGTEEDALEEIMSAERTDDNAENLLQDGALSE